MSTDDKLPTSRLAIRLTEADLARLDAESKAANRTRTQQARMMMQEYWRMVDSKEAVNA